MRYAASKFLIACVLGFGALLPLSFGAELTTDVKVKNFRVVGEGVDPVVVMPCFGPPDEVVRVGGQQILHYRRIPSGERLHVCLSAIATDEMYVLVNGEGIVHELVLTKRTGRGTVQTAHLP